MLEGEADRAGSGAARQRYQGGTDRASGYRRQARRDNRRKRVVPRKDRPFVPAGRRPVTCFWPRNEAGGKRRYQRELTTPSAPSSCSTRIGSRKRLLQHRRRPQGAAAAAAQPRHGPADRAGRPGAALSRWSSSSRSSAPTGRSRSPIRCAMPTRSIGRRPLYRAHRLEKALDTPAHIYYKYEGVSPSGSHKPNTALAQAFYAKQEGVTRFATETGAGQWGSALAFAGSVFGIEVKVYMVRASYDQKPYRRILMETYGAQVVPQPQPRHAVRPEAAGARTRTTRARSASPSARRSRTPSPIRGPSTRSGRCSTSCSCTRRSSARRRMQQMEHGRRGAGRRHRLRWRRLQLRRAGVPVHRPAAARRRQVPRHRRRAGGSAVADARRVRVRLRRHGRDGAAGQDAHAWPRLRAAADPRRRAALPRHGAAGQQARRRWPGRGARRAPERDLRGGRPVSPERRASCPRPSRTTPSARRSTRPLQAKAEGKPRTILFNLSGHGHFDLAAYEAYLAGKLEDYEYQPVERKQAVAA